MCEAGYVSLTKNTGVFSWNTASSNAEAVTLTDISSTANARVLSLPNDVVLLATPTSVFWLKCSSNLACSVVCLQFELVLANVQTPVCSKGQRGNVVVHHSH